MEENNIIINEDIKKPLIEIDNDLIEMSKNLKIINSLKDDIDKILSSIPNAHDEKINSSIKDKYNKIKTQIKKFMNKKRFIYNYIDNEKLSKKNLIDDKNIIEDENEKLIEDNNKLQSIKENINKMQKKLNTLVNDLEKKLSGIKVIQKENELIEELKKNDIDFNDNETLKENQFQIKTSLLNVKAFKYNEEKKQLEEVNKVIYEIKKNTDEMKIISKSQGDTINNLKDEHDYIGNNIEKGIEQINQYKVAHQKDNSKLIAFICCIIFLIITFSCLIYYKIKK